MNNAEILGAIRVRIAEILHDGPKSQSVTIWMPNGPDGYGRVYINGGTKRNYTAWIDTRGDVDCFYAYWGTFGISESILKEIFDEVKNQ